MTEVPPGEPRPEFTTFTLRGDRFAGGRLPLDALVELERYRAILLVAASRAWRRDHGNADLPEDFDRQFDVAIARIEDGSAESVLELAPTPYEDYFTQGLEETRRLFDEITAGLFAEMPATRLHKSSPLTPGAASEPDESEAMYVAANDDGAALNADAPSRPSLISRDALLEYGSLEALRDLGSSLEPEESLEIDWTETAVTRINQRIRVQFIRPLIEAVSVATAEPPKPKRERRPDAIAGRLIAMNAEEKTFVVKTLHYGDVGGTYRKTPELTDDLKEVLNSGSQAPVIRLTGRMSWQAGHLKRILGITSVELFEIESEPWSRNLVELASLPVNWNPDEGASDMISFAALDAAREMLRLTVDHPSDLPNPGIFPMDDGGVHLEWATKNRVTGVEISPDVHFVVHTLSIDPITSDETTTANATEAAAALMGALSE